MLMMTTNKRIATMMNGSRKMKNSKAYIKEVNKSSRALYKDMRDEITGGRFNAARATVDTMKSEAKSQKRGFYTTQFKKMFNDIKLVHLTKEYGRSASKALKTGKLYRRENDIFDNMMQNQNKFMNSGSEDIVQNFDSNRVNASYDAAKATISSMNANASSSNEHSRLQIAETKMGFARMSTALSVGTQQQVQILTGIGSFMNDILRGKLDEGLTLDKSRNALLIEIRDLNKKMLINNDTYQQMSNESSKSAMDLLLEGRFKDALVKGGENVIKEFDTKNIVQIAGNMLPMALQQMISNPFGFVKDMMLSENKHFKRLKGVADPKKIMEAQLMQMLGSNNPIKSRTAKALLVGNTKSMEKLSISTDYNKGAMQWSGIERQALIEVIPTYLRKILSALDKKDELIYNFHKGSFNTVKDMKRGISDFTNREVSGANTGAAMLTDFFREEEFKRSGRNSNYSHTNTFNMFIKDIALSPYPSSMKAILHYDYRAYKKVFPNTPLSKEDFFLITGPAKALYGGTGENADKFREKMEELDKNITKYKEENDVFAAQLSKDASLSGYSAFSNGSRTLSNTASPPPPPAGNGGSPPPPPTESDENMLDDLLKVQNVKNAGVSATSEAELRSIAGNDQGAYDKLLDRANYMNANDFRNSGFKVNAWHFRKWLDTKYAEMSDELKERLTEFAKKEKFKNIIPHVKDFGLYLDEVRYEHIMNANELTSSEKNKIKELKEMQDRQGQFNSAFDGLERSMNQVTEDPNKMEAMSGLIKKMAVAGGIAGIAGASGLIPFAGSMGLPGITAMALGGIGITMLSNRKQMADVLMGGMTPEERANAGKVTSFVFSKAISGLGVGAMTALAAPLLGAGPVLAPLLAATAGIAVAMNSEKSGFKKFFFGDAADSDRTFFQLFKTKMLGDKDSGDDGLFGRFLNPVIEKTGSMFERFNKGLEDKILKPLGDKFKDVVDKIDASNLGQKFKDAMGFSLSEFGTIMKKNVWMPITKSIFGGIKKLFGWGRKKKDEIQDGQKADLDVGNNIMDMYNQQNPPPVPPPVPPTPADPGTAAAGVNKKRSKRRGLNLSGGSILGRGGVLAEDMLEATRVPLKDNKSLIGKGESDPKKHYFSQLDPIYKDIPVVNNIATKVKQAFVEGDSKVGSIGSMGCGIMAAAMVLSRFGRVIGADKKKSEVTPEYINTVLVPLAKPFADNGGINYEYFRAVSNKFNMEYTVRKANHEMFSIKEIKSITAGGKGVLVVLTTQKTLGNHYIVITGINGDNVYYDDPARKRNLLMSYDDMCQAATLAMGITKTKGLFGIIGKLLKGVSNWLTGDSQKTARARKWHIRKELIDRMTREEWQKYRNKPSIPKELLTSLQGRKPMFTHADGKAITNDKGEQITDRFYADVLMKKKITDSLSGSGKNKKNKGEKPKNAIDKIPDKNTYEYKGTGLVPRFLSKEMYFSNDNHYKSLMLSASLHGTSTIATTLGAIYTKLSEQEVTIYNGTNGVAYNVEALKRMNAIKQFGSVSEADKAIGPIDQNNLQNARFFGGRKGIIGRFLKGAGDLKNYVRSKTIDPIIVQGLMIKQGFVEMKDKFFDGLQNFAQDVGDVFKFAVEGLAGFFKGIGTTIGGALKGIGSAIGGTLKGIGSGIGGALKGIGSAISGAIGGVGTIVSSVVNGLVDTVQGLPNLIKDSLGAVVSTMTGVGMGVIKIASTIGSTGYGAAKMVVKDLWGAGGAVLKGIGKGATGIKNFFTGGDAKWKEDESNIQYVRVLGGHIDTVGSVGAVDRDTYVREVKGFKKSNKHVLGTKSTAYRLGGDTLKNNSVNNEVDANQDKSSGVQDKQTALLEEIAGKAGMGGSGGKGDKDKDDTLSYILLGLGALAAAVNELLKKKDEIFKPETTDDGAPVDPRIYSDDEENRDEAKQELGGKLGKWGLRNFGWLKKQGGKILGKGKAIIKGGKRLLKKGAIKILKGKRNIVNFGKGIKSGVQSSWNHLSDAGKKIKGVFTKKGVKQGVAGLLEDGSKKVAGLLEWNGAGKAIKNNITDIIPDEKALALIDDSGKVIAKSTEMLVQMIDKLLNTKAVSALLDNIDKALKSKLVKNVKTFVSKLATNSAVKKAAMKEASGKMLKNLAKVVPYLNAALFAYDFYAGWRDADKYFNVPDSKLTTSMKVTASLARGLMGILTTVPYFLIFCFVPDDMVAKYIFDHWVGSEQQKKDLADAQTDTKKRYDDYKKNLGTGQKALTFDKWVAKDGKTPGILEKMGDKAASGSMFGFGTMGGNAYAPGMGTGNAYAPGMGTGNADQVGNVVGKSITGAGTGMVTKNNSVTSGGTFYFPTQGKLITSRALKNRKHPVSGIPQPHKGIDISVPAGTPIYAIKAGKVTRAGWQDADPKVGYGQRIEIKHDVGRSVYAHLNTVLVSVGQIVQKGELIGYSGNTGSSTGPHLHFGVFDGKDNVINPESLYAKGSFTYGPSVNMKDAVFGNRNAVRGTGSVTEGSGIQSKMYGQNFNINMSVGGDNLSLAQVGCGPVTTNLFLQESGVKEDLMKTAQALRYRRSSDTGFDSKTLSNYITNRRVSNKVLTKADKSTLVIAKFGILFAKRNSTINSLDDHHAMFMKNANNLGATLFDPYKETFKFYTWNDILSSTFEYIIPGGSGNVSGPRTDSSVLSNSRSAVDVSKYETIKNLDKKVSGLLKTKKDLAPTGTNDIDVAVSGNKSSSNNINLESKLDTIITLLTHIVANTSVQPTAPVNKPDQAAVLNKVIKSIMNSASTPKSILEKDAWWESKKRLSKGGL